MATLSSSRRPHSRRHAALAQLAAGTSSAPASGPKVMMPDGRIVPMSTISGFIPGSGGGFTGAVRTQSSRGHIVFPTLDTSREINATNRTEVMRKARWLYNNDPFSKRCADGYSRMIGWNMFQPNTPDREWNTLAKRIAMDAAMSAQQFDRAGKYNFFSYQLLLSRRLGIDGDMLSVPVQGPNGTTKVKCYEGHQVGDGLGAGGDDGFYDGVRTDRHGLALAYSILDSGDQRKRKILRAGQAHLAARYERGGQRRGMSAFHCVVNGMLDIREVENDMTLAVKTRNTIGFYFAPRDGHDAPRLRGSEGMQTALKQYRRESLSGDEEEEEEVLSYEEVFAGGNMPSFPDMEPKILESTQPHENEMAFLNWKIRRIALGFDLAPELIYDIGNLNGNTQRWLAADAQEMLEARRMEILTPFCQWWWYHFIGAEIASGRLREPVIPAAMRDHVGWWSVDWIPPKKKTIDRGREGKLNIDERQKLLRTLDEHYSEQQKDWNVEVNQWLDEIIAINEMAAAKNMPQHQIDMILANMLAPPAGTAISDDTSALAAEE